MAKKKKLDFNIQLPQTFSAASEIVMVKLRLVEDADIQLIEKWLHKEHVKKWYEIPHLGVTLEDWMTEIIASPYRDE